MGKKWLGGVALLALPVVAFAANPHFTRCDGAAAGGVLTLSGQVAGLGNQMRPRTPLELEATATVVCLDPTTDPPTELGSATVAQGVAYPPKNGERTYTFTLDASGVLLCEPPGELVLVGVQTCDLTHGICCPEPE